MHETSVFADCFEGDAGNAGGGENEDVDEREQAEKEEDKDEDCQEQAGGTPVTCAGHRCVGGCSKQGSIRRKDVGGGMRRQEGANGGS